MSADQQLFEQRASATLKRVAGIYSQRGGEYSDTWKEAQFLKMKAVARKLGAQIPQDAFRAIACAAFCDMKYARLAGGYKEDSIDDGIAYDAFLADEVRSVEVDRQLSYRKAESAAQMVEKEPCSHMIDPANIDKWGYPMCRCGAVTTAPTVELPSANEVTT